MSALNCTSDLIKQYASAGRAARRSSEDEFHYASSTAAAEITETPAPSSHRRPNGRVHLQLQGVLTKLEATQQTLSQARRSARLSVTHTEHPSGEAARVTSETPTLLRANSSSTNNPVQNVTPITDSHSTASASRAANRAPNRLLLDVADADTSISQTRTPELAAVYAHGLERLTGRSSAHLLQQEPVILPPITAERGQGAGPGGGEPVTGSAALRMRLRVDANLTASPPPRASVLNNRTPSPDSQIPASPTATSSHLLPRVSIQLASPVGANGGHDSSGADVSLTLASPRALSPENNDDEQCDEPQPFLIASQLAHDCGNVEPFPTRRLQLSRVAKRTKQHAVANELAQDDSSNDSGAVQPASKKSKTCNLPVVWDLQADEDFHRRAHKEQRKRIREAKRTSSKRSTNNSPK